MKRWMILVLLAVVAFIVIKSWPQKTEKNAPKTPLELKISETKK